MASPTSSRSKKKTGSENRPAASQAVAPAVAAVSTVPAQAIFWGQVVAALRPRWHKSGLQWDWSKPKHLPLAWELPEELGRRFGPWLQLLASVMPKHHPTAKQIRTVRRRVREWVAAFPHRCQRWGGQSRSGGESADLSEPAASPDDPRLLGLEALAVVWLLPILSDLEDSELVEAALAIMLELGDAAAVPGECPITAALWQVELPLTLAAWLPGDVFPPSLRQQALEQLKLQVEELIDGNGLPGHEGLPAYGGLLAGWTRTWALERWIPELQVDPALRDRYRLALQGYLRLLRNDGTPLWSNPAHPGVAGGMVTTWLRLGRDAEERTIAEWVCPSRLDFSAVGGPRLKEAKLCDAADYTEWGKVAILRNRWKRKSDKLGVNFGGREVQIELNSRCSWLSGGLATQLSLNDQPLPLGDRWEEICWQSDEDTVYLEIQNELADDRGVLQRQFVLARQARLCLIADAVLLNTRSPADSPAETAAPLRHRWELPLAPGVTWESAPETREGWLVAGGDRVSFLPVALPEWRIAHARGTLAVPSGGVVMDYELPAQRLYQAVIIDLDTKRSRKPLSWRQLTVGENLRPVPLDQALGVRVHLHKQQYLLYRSLTPPTSRSLLGQNIYSDFYLGQFHPDGTAKTLIMIESA